MIFKKYYMIPAGLISQGATCTVNMRINDKPVNLQLYSGDVLYIPQGGQILNDSFLSKKIQMGTLVNITPRQMVEHLLKEKKLTKEEIRKYLAPSDYAVLDSFEETGAFVAPPVMNDVNKRVSPVTTNEGPNPTGTIIEATDQNQLQQRKKIPLRRRKIAKK